MFKHSMEKLDNSHTEDQNVVLTPKKVEAYSEFILMLQRIHTRLIAEGYIIKDGQIHKSERLLQHEKSIDPNKFR